MQGDEGPRPGGCRRWPPKEAGDLDVELDLICFWGSLAKSGHGQGRTRHGQGQPAHWAPGGYARWGWNVILGCCPYSPW